MATPIRYTAANVGLTPVVLTTAANTVSLFAVNFTNRLNQTVLVDFYANTGVNIYLVKSFELTANASAVVMGGDASKHFLLNGDTLNIVSDTAASVDAYVSGVMGVTA